MPGEAELVALPEEHQLARTVGPALVRAEPVSPAVPPLASENTASVPPSAVTSPQRMRCTPIPPSTMTSIGRAASISAFSEVTV